ncbi:MAG: tRNA (adenosine(37)-N6)-threonylcarbamoyltransferase complex dimerization subunit type 1 TsaB [Hydrogenovibrio sp.]
MTATASILAIETSTQACSACLIHHGTSYLEYELAPQKHADRILTMVEKVLHQADARPGDIQLLAFGEGPGAFTGVRIATGVIQGLAFGWDKPVLGVSTLEALAWQGYQATGALDWLAFLDARMQEMYLQACRIESGRLVSQAPQLMSAAQAHQWIETQTGTPSGVGDIAVEFPVTAARFSAWYSARPSAQAIAEVAQQRLSQAHSVDDVLPMPLYLRNQVAEKPKPKPPSAYSRKI